MQPSCSVHSLSLLFHAWPHIAQLETNALTKVIFIEQNARTKKYK